MRIALLALSVLAFSSGERLHANPIIFSGSDNGANSTDPRPNSNATAASFNAAASALGPVSLITFESAPVGTFTSLSVAPGVTLTGLDFTGSATQSIRNTPAGTPDGLFGYNTTSGGANFAFINGGSLTFTFTNPVQAFGAYISGLQLANEAILFSDGTSQIIPLPTLSSGIAFVGFTDAGKSVTSITISTNAAGGLGDFVGVDDVSFVPTAATAVLPEPASLAVFGILAAVAGVGYRRRA